MNEYGTLSKAEQDELVDRIANGDISRSCPRAKVDWINIKLASGKRCVGAYKWETDNGDFLRLIIHAR
jgi:hypothetical protein